MVKERNEPMHRLNRGSTLRSLLGPVLAAFMAVLAAASAAAGDRTEADAVTLPLREAVYAHALDEAGVYALHANTLERIGVEVSDGIEAHRARALAHYYLGRWHQAIKTRAEMVEYATVLRKERYLALRRFYLERDQAMAAYRNARAEAETYLASRPDAEAHRLYGEILGQMLFLGDAGDVMSIGRKARKNVKAALELDPTLPKALIQEASRMAYTPLSYGGDPQDARALYREILRGGVDDREDLFNIYGGFGMAAFAEFKDEEALSWFEEAAAVYPGNVFAAGMADYLRGEPQ